jgi:hypothetical protein
MITQNFTLVSAADMSSNVTSNAVEIQGISNVSLSAVYTGSPVGSVKLQASVDAGANWSDVASSSFSISSAGVFIWNYAPCAVPLLRVVYTATSGSGALTVTVFKKAA